MSILHEKEYLEAKKIVQRYETGKDIIKPSFWYMKSSWTFAKITGNDIEHVRQNAIKLAKENPHGMVCPVNIMRDEKELRQIGPCCHVDKDGNVDLTEWYNEIIKEPCVLNYKGE